MACTAVYVSWASHDFASASALNKLSRIFDSKTNNRHFLFGSIAALYFGGMTSIYCWLSVSSIRIQWSFGFRFFFFFSFLNNSSRVQDKIIQIVALPTLWASVRKGTEKRWYSPLLPGRASDNSEGNKKYIHTELGVRLPHPILNGIDGNFVVK